MESYDVIVCGGGFAGAAAAISAARGGAKVLLVEYNNCLGGAAAECLVNPFMPYWTHDENKKRITLSTGIFSEICREMRKLSAEAEDFISRVTTSCSIGNWNACYGSANAAKTAYDALTPEDREHPRVANAYQALSILLEHLQDGTILNEERAEAQAVLNSYQAPVSEGDFTGGIKIESEDALLTAAKACNDAGKGIAEFNITYTSEYGEYSFTFSLGYTVSSVTAARSMAVSLPAVVF